MTEQQRISTEERRTDIAELAAGLRGPAPIDPRICAQAAQVLQEQAARIEALESEKSAAFRAGMEAEAYLIKTPPSEDG